MDNITKIGKDGSYPDKNVKTDKCGYKLDNLVHMDPNGFMWVKLSSCGQDELSSKKGKKGRKKPV